MSDRGKSPAVVLGESVRTERMLQGKTTRELAQLAGLHASQISRLENGLADAKVSTVVRVARALQVTVAQLFEGKAPTPLDHDDDSTEDFVVDRIVYQRLGQALRRERESKGLRQDDLALAAGLGLRAVGEIEAGKATAEFRTWLAVIQALGFKLVIVRRHSQSPP